MRQAAVFAKWGAAVAVCVVLTGCATAKGSEVAASPDVAGLFRTPSQIGGLAPAPTAGWYVPRQAPRYVKMGLARQTAPRPGWLARLLPRRKAEPAAVIAETAALPLPSVVQITSVATGATLRLRIEERAAMGDDLVRLNAAAAQELGVSGAEAKLVRVRFIEPAIAYREGAPLTYAMARRPRTHSQLAVAPAAPAHVPPAAMSADTSVRPIATARQEQSLARTRVLAVAAPAPSALPRPPEAPSRAAARAQAATLSVQAGAFANPGNAKRAVAMLTGAGPTRIQSLQRADGVTLYRVLVDCQGGAQQAEAVRAKVVRAGFADARVVRAS